MKRSSKAKRGLSIAPMPRTSTAKQAMTTNGDISAQLRLISNNNAPDSIFSISTFFISFQSRQSLLPFLRIFSDLSISFPSRFNLDRASTSYTSFLW
jgi:hypothetical protein